MPTWAAACNTSEPTREQAGGEGFVDASSRQIIGNGFPHTVHCWEKWPNPPESPNVRMSAPLLITERPCEVSVDKPKGLDTVALGSGSQCQPPRFGLERSDVGEQVTRDKASALGPRLDQGTQRV